MFRTAVARLLALIALFLLPPAALADPIDINTASASELDTLPGIGPAKAAAIVEYRTQHGPFPSVDALDDVPGIGPATLEGLRDQVTVGAAAPPSSAPPSPSTPPAARPSGPQPGTGAIDINTASASELQALPGIGATKAAAIVEDRTVNGPFASCADLTRVVGIGPATVAGIADRCVAN